MNKGRHARVKEIFLRAVDVPAADRQDFVAQACGNDAALKREVESLLAHHDTITIMKSAARAPTVVMDRRLDSRNPSSVSESAEESAIPPLPNSPTDFELVLRRRLTAVVGVYSLGFGLSFLHPLTDDPDWSIRVPALLMLLAILGLLYSPLRLHLRALRTIEFVVLISAGVQAGFLDVRPIIDAAAQGDEVTMISAYHWNFFVWSMLILIYGVFMPNTWRRAALILIPAAAIPYIEDFVLRARIPELDAALDNDQFGMPVPMTPIAALTGILAAHMIHTVRREATQARRFAQYRLKRLLGVGGMGEVYEAEHLLLKRPCAVKLIRAAHASDPTTLARFEREVQATARLTHWNTVEIYDYGQTTEGVFYYVMELLPGMSLAELVSAYGPTTASRAVHFLRQACGALQEAHDIGLIHRDIKPANIFAARRGGVDDVVKLLDFGLVRNTTATGDPQLTAANVIGGTPAYMSPEQADPSFGIDWRSDLYSLGAVGYFLLTGRPPFPQRSAAALLISHLQMPVEPPSRHAVVPHDVEQCILRCLEKLPDDRFQSARELDTELAKCACAGQWTDEVAAEWWLNKQAASEQRESSSDSDDRHTDGTRAS